MCTALFTRTEPVKLTQLKQHSKQPSNRYVCFHRFSDNVCLFSQITKHYSKPGVEAREVLPLFPDFDVSLSFSYTHVVNKQYLHNFSFLFFVVMETTLCSSDI